MKGKCSGYPNSLVRHARFELEYITKFVDERQFDCGEYWTAIIRYKRGHIKFTRIDSDPSKRYGTVVGNIYVSLSDGEWIVDVYRQNGKSDVITFIHIDRLINFVNTSIAKIDAYLIGNEPNFY